MGKASSSKKVARAARAGGRSSGSKQRNLLFPGAIGVIVLLGSGLIAYAADERKSEADVAPVVNEDHWHAAFGVYICDDIRFREDGEGFTIAFVPEGTTDIPKPESAAQLAELGAADGSPGDTVPDNETTTTAPAATDTTAPADPTATTAPADPTATTAPAG